MFNRSVFLVWMSISTDQLFKTSFKVNVVINETFVPLYMRTRNLFFRKIVATCDVKSLVCSALSDEKLNVI